MRILSIGTAIIHETLDITTITHNALKTATDLTTYDYIIISGGDGTIRRTIQALHHLSDCVTFILNPIGSFNVVAKMHRVKPLQIVLDRLAKGETLTRKNHPYFSLNQEIFLFSAGNMGDLQHIFLAETLRFGILKNNMGKYILAILILLPLHLVITPFMLMSQNRFFIFTPLRWITKLGSFYGKVDKEITIPLENNYNHIELDGDIVTIEENTLHIKPAGDFFIAT